MMKFKTILFLLILGVGLNSLAQAQLKIGYVNVSLVLAYMPETKTMQEQIVTYRKKLGENLKLKEDNFRARYATFAEKAQAGNLSEAEAKPMQEELQKLDQEIKAYAAEADQKLAAKQQELMTPIETKLNDAIKQLAAQGGYTYILNTQDGSGASVLLHGPDAGDITKDLMQILGIKIPESN